MTEAQRGTPTGQPGSVVHHGHGNSIAAWTAVAVFVLGSTVIAVGVIATSWWVSIVGAVVCALGALSGKVLSAMGFGVDGRHGGH